MHGTPSTHPPASSIILICIHVCVCVCFQTLMSVHLGMEAVNRDAQTLMEVTGASVTLATLYREMGSTVKVDILPLW